MKKTLQKDIAEKLGVSIAQVSRALNHREHVSDDVRIQALRLAKELNYHNASWRHKRNLAVVVSHFSDFNAHLLNRILAEARAKDCSVSIVPCQDIDLLNDQMFDGAFSISHDPAQLKWCEKFRMPLVVLNQFGDPVERISAVFPDADDEVRTAVEHFISLGHRKIARIRFRGRRSTERELQRGVGELFRVAEFHGIRDQVCSLCLDNFEQGIDSVVRLIDEGYTAFLVVMSDWTPRLLHAIRETGREVPDDISLVTYEYEGSAYQNPPLTTLQYDYDRLVKAAFEQLFKEIAGKKEIPQIQIPCKLNIRNSTGPCPRNK